MVLAALIGGAAAIGAYSLGYRAGLDACPAAAQARIESNRAYYEWLRTLPPLED